jgi:hypothetical protein
VCPARERATSAVGGQRHRCRLCARRPRRPARSQRQLVVVVGAQMSMYWRACQVRKSARKKCAERRPTPAAPVRAAQGPYQRRGSSCGAYVGVSCECASEGRNEAASCDLGCGGVLSACLRWLFAPRKLVRGAETTHRLCAWTAAPMLRRAATAPHARSGALGLARARTRLVARAAVAAAGGVVVVGGVRRERRRPRRRA